MLSNQLNGFGAGERRVHVSLVNPLGEQRALVERADCSTNDHVLAPPEIAWVYLKDGKPTLSGKPSTWGNRWLSDRLIFIMFLTLALALLLLPPHAALGGANSSTSCDILPDLIRSSILTLGSVETAFVPTNSLNVSGTFNSVSFCRVNGSVPYPENNTVFFEVWLPDTDVYNGRFLAVGNGGMAGTIDHVAMLENVNKGFATAGGDSGHRASENNGGNAYPGGVNLPYLHDRNQVLAWIRNSIAFLTPSAKGITSVYYGTQPHHSYYTGCSTGGAQGFALAEYHPDLFDGIAAGCPGNWYSHLALSFLWNQQATLGSRFLPQESLDRIKDAVLDQCDALDGVEDRVLENPLACKFDIVSLACKDGASNTSTCLTPEQIVAAKDIYAGPRHSETNASLYPGFDLGTEAEWMYQEGTLSLSFSLPLLQNMVFDDLSYNGSTFNWGTDVDAMDTKVGSLIDAISPNLTAYKTQGGKLLVTQGWADPLNAATWPIDHLNEVARVTGGERHEWLSLFMIPGGGHCGGASTYPQVPTKQNTLEALVDWVEKGKTPEDLLGTAPADGSRRTRKICRWPRAAKYNGGNADDSHSYTCEDQRR
ncbi:tannase and feruloyl esterase [Colletotrichum navitas]|uniref:Carboxylic ester hydrolase n=1 Tax=Colletotrichum navitas TaxID=681940 RepID=A0AAD8VBC8_9PEZI|nr:tannase and feruloyl esterase [Colletotrichum navitas]KAK1598923.1 tannase and feruloyl esterase [Colletotrichum navitas]